MKPLLRTDRQAAATLPGWLEVQARSQGGAVALRHKQLGIWQPRSWREVLADVAALAGGLAERGFRQGSTLVVLSHPRPEALLAALAAQWLGGVAAVLDPHDDPAVPDAALLALRPDFVFAEGLAQVERARRAGLAPAVLAYADARGLGGQPLPGLVASRALAVAGGRVPALLARPDGVAFVFLRAGGDGAVERQAITHAELLREGRLLVEGEQLSEREEAFAARAFAASGQARYLLAPWLIAGFRLNFPESLATRDNDRRELGPTLVAGTRETWQRVEHLVRDLLPAPGSWQRRLVERGLDPRARGVSRLLGYWLVRRPLRDVIGFTRTRVPLIVGEPLPDESARFFARLGIEVRNWADPARWQAAEPAGGAAPARDAGRFAVPSGHVQPA